MAANYSKYAKQILSLAGDEALIAKATTIAPVHILQGIVRTPESEAADLLRSIGIDLDSLKSEVLAMGDASSSTMAGQDVLSRAEGEAKAANSAQVGSDHLLAALTGESLGEVAVLLAKHGITSRMVSSAMTSAKATVKANLAAAVASKVSAGGLLGAGAIPPGGQVIMSRSAAEPVGAYSHARRVGPLLFLAGIGPRKRGTKDIPGVTLDAAGNIAAYDIEAQIRSTFENVRLVLEESGSSWANIVDVTVFLTNMKQDFMAFNRLWADYFKSNQPARTTVEINALPTPIAFEVKVIATIA